jgi:hypothetical protein
MKRPRIPVLFACLALAACTGEPTHRLPYGVMTKEPGLLGVITNQSGVEVMPPEGAGGALATALSEALAAALRDQDIAALAGQELNGGHRISGKARIQDNVLVTVWKLHDAGGALAAQFETREALPAGAREDAIPASILQAMAGHTAAAFAPHLLPGEAHSAALRVYVPDIAAAPGDGGKTLPSALRSELRAAGLNVVDAPAGTALTIAGSVQLSDLDAERQLVSLSWLVRAPDGQEIGRIDQSNPVPRGQLEGGWGGIAYAAASGAADGVIPLLDDYRASR